LEFYQRLDLYPAIAVDAAGREIRVRLNRKRGTFRGWIRVEPGAGWMVQSRLEVQLWEGDVPDVIDWLGLIKSAAPPNMLLLKSENYQGYGWSQTIRYRNRSVETILQHTIFNTDNHNTRIYAFEYDLAGQLRVPSWSGQGQRTNLVIQYNTPARGLLLRFKTGRTFYTDRFEVGSGADTTTGPVRNDIAVQIVLNR
jgi:hypothetical protein